MRCRNSGLLFSLPFHTNWDKMKMEPLVLGTRWEWRLFSEKIFLRGAQNSFAFPPRSLHFRPYIPSLAVNINRAQEWKKRVIKQKKKAEPGLLSSYSKQTLSWFPLPWEINQKQEAKSSSPNLEEALLAGKGFAGVPLPHSDVWLYSLGLWRKWKIPPTFIPLPHWVRHRRYKGLIFPLFLESAPNLLTFLIAYFAGDSPYLGT